MKSRIRTIILLIIISSVVTSFVTKAIVNYMNEWTNYDVEELEVFHKYVTDEFEVLVFKADLNTDHLNIDIKIDERLTDDEIIIFRQRVLQLLSSNFMSELNEYQLNEGYSVCYITLTLFERPITTFEEYFTLYGDSFDKNSFTINGSSVDLIN